MIENLAVSNVKMKYMEERYFILNGEWEGKVKVLKDALDLLDKVKYSLDRY